MSKPEPPNPYVLATDYCRRAAQRFGWVLVAFEIRFNPSVQFWCWPVETVMPLFIDQTVANDPTY